MDNPITLNE